MDNCNTETIELDEIGPDVEMGQSGSKGSKKKGEALKTTKGIATSFGFKKRPASTSRVDNARNQYCDKNGNNGELEDYDNSVERTNGRRRSITPSPFNRNRKDFTDRSSELPPRTKRFGFGQQTINKTAKVRDIHNEVEPAFQNTTNNVDFGRFNNNVADKPPSRCNITPQPAQTTIKQTVIVTYAPRQYTTTLTNTRSNYLRSQSATRANDHGRITVQSNLLPRLQTPLRNDDVKVSKQVANMSRRRSGMDGLYSREDSLTDQSMSSNATSPTSKRRPRTLQLVMNNPHKFHLQELHVPNLDLLDDAVVTQDTVIPLPKFPSTFGDEQLRTTIIAQNFIKPSQIRVNCSAIKDNLSHEKDLSKLSVLERYRMSRGHQEIMRDENKIQLDRLQKERLDKQNTFIRREKSDVTSSRASSKESTPNSRSETFQYAGESLANRSQDDASISLSISLTDEDKSRNEIPVRVQLKKTTVILGDRIEGEYCRAPMSNSAHPMLCSVTSFNSTKAELGGEVRVSACSAVTTSTNTEPDNLMLTLDEANIDLEALERSTNSLIEDETSPADSLISSTSSVDSNDDLNELCERELSVDSSAYLTANTNKTKSNTTKEEGPSDDMDIINETNEKSPDGKDPMHGSSGSGNSPTHASLSLSDGRDYFDDEIADQPALTLNKNEDSPSMKEKHDSRRQMCSSHEKVGPSPQVRHRKLGPSMPPSESVASLDTLSSLASDDLMLDENIGRSMTSLQSVQDYVDRLDSSIRSGLNKLDEEQLKKEMKNSKSALQEWNRLLDANKVLDRELGAVSMQSSAKSLICVNRANIPVRASRLLSRARVSLGGAGADTQSDTSDPELPTANLLQDVVDIKSLLLQLKRVLLETDSEDKSFICETHDPLNYDGPRPQEQSEHSAHTSELRRQILYLQSELEERDRIVRMLQDQMSRLSDGNSSDSERKSRDSALPDEMCNVATQTERIRPAFSSNLNHTNSPGLVSWSDQMNGRLSQSVEPNNSRPNRNGTVNPQCTCPNNKYTNGTLAKEEEDLRTNSRIGSRYLQAINKSANKNLYVKRDLSVNDRIPRPKQLYNGRSKSIENFKTNNLSVSTENFDIDNNIHSKNHDLNGYSRLNGSEIKSSQNDISSSELKSIPASCIAKKICNSGIPRRLNDNRLMYTRGSYKASAV